MNYHADSDRGFTNAEFLFSQNEIYNLKTNTYICQYHNSNECYQYGRKFPELRKAIESKLIVNESNFEANVIDYLLHVPRVLSSYQPNDNDTVFSLCLIFKEFLKSITYGISIIHNQKKNDDVICQSLYVKFCDFHINFLNAVAQIIPHLKSKDTVVYNDYLNKLYENIYYFYKKCESNYDSYITYYSDDFFTIKSPNDYFLVVVIMDIIFLTRGDFVKIPRKFLEFMPQNCLLYLTDDFIKAYPYIFEVGIKQCLGCYLHKDYIRRYLLVKKHFSNINLYVDANMKKEREEEYMYMEKKIQDIKIQYGQSIKEICRYKNLKCPPLSPDIDDSVYFEYVTQFLEKHQNKLHINNF